jgi:hypothetical protein
MTPTVAEFVDDLNGDARSCQFIMAREKWIDLGRPVFLMMTVDTWESRIGEIQNAKSDS